MTLKPVVLGLIAVMGVWAGASPAAADDIPRLGLFGPPLHRGLCSKAHVFPAPGRSASPEVQATLSRFLKGQSSDYADMSPAMAEVVRNYVRAERASQPGPLSWSGQSGPGELMGVDEAGNDVYLVHRKGGLSHWNLAVNREGKVEAAYHCGGAEGLVGYEASHPGPYERGPGYRP